MATLGALSVLSGAVHMLAPDHWLPASVVAWQRGWGYRRTVGFAALAHLSHVLLGVLIFFAFDPILLGLDPSRLFRFTLGLVLVVMAIRLVRFSRVREVLRAGPSSAWGIVAVFSLLGPCESVIPILIKSHQLGTGYLLPVAAFVLGSWIAGSSLVLAGRVLWDRPFWLPRSVNWAWRVPAILPVAASLGLGLRAILRI
jgi:hypothetical protein